MTTEDEILTSTIMYDTYHDYLIELAKNKSKMNQLVRFIAQIKVKNSDAFDTYYIGRRVLINAREWNEFFNIIGLKQENIISTIRTVKRYDDVNNLIDQFSVASILLLLVGALTETKQENLAKFIYLFTYFRPYASRVSQIFKIIPNDSTIEMMINNLSLKYDLKKQQSLYGCLTSMAENAYNGAYLNRKRKDVLAGQITDNDLWLNFQSTIFTSIGQFLKTIFVAHAKYKSISMNYTSDAIVVNKDGDTNILDMSNGEIDAKNRIIYKISRSFAIAPINDSYAKFAISRSGLYTGNDVALSNLKTLITRALDNDQEQCNLLFNYLITAFLNTVNDYTQKKYTIKDINTPVFTAKIYSIIYNTRNTIDENKIEAKNIVFDMLNKYLDEFEFLCKTYKDQYRKAFVLYCATFIQKTA